MNLVLYRLRLCAGVVVAGELTGLPYLRYGDHVHCEVSLQSTHFKRNGPVKPLSFGFDYNLLKRRC
jgi:hypothetical protein